jgi:hypothetical protein
VSQVLLIAVPAVSGMVLVAAVAGNASGLRAAAPRGRRLARAWARDRGVSLVEASLLAAGPADRRAATILVRQLIGHADRHGIAVLARPRDDRVAAMYAALGFRDLSGAGGRVLLRVPRR